MSDRHDPPAPTGGTTRRDVLRKAALAGAVAWGTPVVTSLNTPAMAQGTLAAGDYRRYYTIAGSCAAATMTETIPAPNGQACTSPSNWNNLPRYTPTVTITQNVAAQTYAFTISAANCTYTQTTGGRSTAQCNEVGNICEDATQDAALKVSTYSYSGANNCTDASGCAGGGTFPPFSYIKLIMTCT